MASLSVWTNLGFHLTKEDPFWARAHVPAVKAIWFVIPEARSPYFIYSVIKLLLILIKLKNLFVNESPGAPPGSAALLRFSTRWTL